MDRVGRQRIKWLVFLKERSRGTVFDLHSTTCSVGHQFTGSHCWFCIMQFNSLWYIYVFTIIAILLFSFFLENSNKIEVTLIDTHRIDSFLFGLSNSTMSFNIYRNFIWPLSLLGCRTVPGLKGLLQIVLRKVPGDEQPSYCQGQYSCVFDKHVMLG